MIPLQVNEKYILSRTYGNIGQMFDKIEVEEGYTIVKEILDERLQALKNQSLLVEDLTEMDSYDTWIMAEKCSARTEAINQKKTERYQKLYQAKSRLLEAMGIEDVTAVLGNPDQDADTDEDWNMDEEEDIESDYSGSCSLYNDKGEVALEIKDVHVNDLNGYICGNEHVGWTNLRTGEEMYLSLTDKITI